MKKFDDNYINQLASRLCDDQNTLSSSAEYTTSLMHEAASELQNLRNLVNMLYDEIEDCKSTLTSWFDISDRTREDITPILLEGLQGYLRRCRVGGMPAELSNRVYATLEDYCRLYVGLDLTPVVRGLLKNKTSP